MNKFQKLYETVINEYKNYENLTENRQWFKDKVIDFKFKNWMKKEIKKGNLIKNDDNTYDAIRFNMSNGGFNDLKNIPIKFRNVSEYFFWFRSKLSSLENAPEKVGDDFGCSYNKLTSLLGCPKSVGGTFDCQFNYLKSLQYGPTNVEKDYLCVGNDLTSLKGIPKVIKGGVFVYKKQINFFKRLS